MEEKDREIMVGKNRLYLREDSIIHLTIAGEVNEKTANAILEVSSKMRSMVEGKEGMLIDLNKAGKQTAEARRIGIDNFNKEKTAKVALYGLHPVAKILASFIIGVTKNKDIRFFKTEEEALQWLKV